MEDGPALFLAAVIVIILVVGVAYAWQSFVGWTTFPAYKAGDIPKWQPTTGSDISRLRFKDCVFTVTRSDGTAATLDATPALNSMAVAYKSGMSNMPSTLELSAPLNPFSFTIVGFNDKATVADPTVAPWCTVPTATCAGGATATLTGKVRTI
jgi:hypothetical protein